MITLSKILSAVSRLGDKLCNATKNAESRCRNVYLELHGDGSGRLVFKWTQCAKTEEAFTEPSGMYDLLMTVGAELEELETDESFDSLPELRNLLEDHGVL